jgi:glycine cleavage system aminomethyltransferase T
MSANQTFEQKTMGGVPMYPDIVLYGNIMNDIRIWEGDGWKQESMSWKESCYIHAGISTPEITFRGPDAQKLLSAVSINDCYKWPIGKAKHLVMCDKDGLVANHGLVIRDSEDSFRQSACLPWAIFRLHELGMNVQVIPRNVFIFQVAGPACLKVLEQVTGENLRDVDFLMTRPTKILGSNAKVEVTRIGMSGSIAYELRGDIEDGPAIYDIVYQAGKPLGMKRLGWRTYCVNHTEGGFPQLGCTFIPTCFLDKQYQAVSGGSAAFSGSANPADLRARLRTPAECDWTWMAKFDDHDFIGREAVEAEALNPKRKLVTLCWNAEDIVDTYASLFRQGEDYKTFELPIGQQSPAAGHADYVVKNGENIGVSSAPAYSYYYREMISHCVIDVDQAQIGNEVIVQWGDFGKRIKDIRATVAGYPYLDLPRNRNYDLSAV